MMDSIENKLQAILNADEMKLFINKTFNKDDILFHQDELCTEVNILIEGEIMMINYDEEGHESIFNVMEPGSFFGNNLLFSSHPYYLGHIVGVTNGQYLCLRKDDLITLLHTNKEFFNLYMQIIADKTINVTKRLKIMSIQNTTQRFMAFLEYKDPLNKGLTFISVTKLAKELSLPRETTSRIISRLVTEGKIIKTNKTIRQIKNAS